MNDNTDKLPAFYQRIIEDSIAAPNQYLTPQGDTVFGFWMQTLADLEFLDLELQGLTDSYVIDPVRRNVEFKGDDEFVRLRIAHLEKVNGKATLHTEFVDAYGDTNAYAFHNLYPYKGKFYPRIVRSLINTFKLNPGDQILDPFNGSGTTTHEATLMGIKSVGIDVTPMGVLLADLKNELPFLSATQLKLSDNAVSKIFNRLEKNDWGDSNKVIESLMLAIYFDTLDAFSRTSRYKKKGKDGLFREKFNYITECHKKLLNLKKSRNLDFAKAEIIEADVLNLKSFKNFANKFDAIITSPPYYFSIDYVGKDKIAYDYLDVDIKQVEAQYLGRKTTLPKKRYGKLPAKVILYYDDLKTSVENMFWALKSGGKLALIVGDSTVGGIKIPTTMVTKTFCEEAGFELNQLIFNPLLGVRNRAIRGESVLLCEKP